MYFTNYEHLLYQSIHPLQNITIKLGLSTL